MADDGLGHGVIVLGMHRSGTSAVTGMIDALGLPACVAEDRFPPFRWNARGNYESRSLTYFDEQLLNGQGGMWWRPPPPAPHWIGNAEQRSEAARLFAAAHPFTRWVWKDPRACLLLPFWDAVLGADLPRIIVLRHPAECAASLEERNHLPRELSLALAERYLGDSLRGSAGRPVLVTGYDELLNDPTEWCRRVADFLSSTDLALPQPLAVERAADFLDPGLHHHHADVELPPGLRELWAWAREHRGAHKALSIDDLS